METKMDRDEAEDLIGRAARIDGEAAEKLSRSEVIEAAREVGVSEAAVRAAERERRHLDDVREARRTNLKWGSVATLAVLLCGFVAFQAIGALVRSRLSMRWELVQRRRADVRTSLTRRTFVTDYWQFRRLLSCERAAQAPLEDERTVLEGICAQEQRDRDVEIAGAENRVTTAVRRYDADVAGYNRYVGSVTWEPIRDFPRHALFSSEVSQW